jgi:hypothetical protein
VVLLSAERSPAEDVRVITYEARVSFVSYYAACLESTWDTTWNFAGDKLPWGIAVAGASAMLAAVCAKWIGNSWRPVLTSGLVGAVGGPLIAFLGLFVMNLLRFPPTHEANLDTINQRIQTLENRPIAGALDARVPELFGKVSKLEEKVASIDNLIRAQTCLDRLNSQAPKELIDTTLENARKLVKTSTALEHGGNPVAQWTTLLNNIRMYVLPDCYPGNSLEFNYDPTAEQLENPVPDEPQTNNPDLVHRYRRFYLQSQFSLEKLETVRNDLKGMINGFRERISNSKDYR